MPPHSAKLAFFTLALLAAVWPAAAQGNPPPAAAPGPAPAAAPAPAGFAFANLRPALANVQNAISGLSISHWKAPSATRAATQQDVASMQRDLSATLPELMTQAEGASAALSPSFAVFRNIDALYDVLLRVTETAALAGSESDASSLEEARAGLEDGQGQTWRLAAPVHKRPGCPDCPPAGAGSSRRGGTRGARQNCGQRRPRHHQTAQKEANPGTTVTSFPEPLVLPAVSKVKRKLPVPRRLRVQLGDASDRFLLCYGQLSRAGGHCLGKYCERP